MVGQVGNLSYGNRSTLTVGRRGEAPHDPPYGTDFGSRHTRTAPSSLADTASVPSRLNVAHRLDGRSLAAAEALEEVIAESSGSI